MASLPPEEKGGRASAVGQIGWPCKPTDPLSPALMREREWKCQGLWRGHEVSRAIQTKTERSQQAENKDTMGWQSLQTTKQPSQARHTTHDTFQTAEQRADGNAAASSRGSRTIVWCRAGDCAVIVGYRACWGAGQRKLTSMRFKRQDAGCTKYIYDPSCRGLQAGL